MHTEKLEHQREGGARQHAASMNVKANVARSFSLSLQVEGHATTQISINRSIRRMTVLQGPGAVWNRELRVFES